MTPDEAELAHRRAAAVGLGDAPPAAFAGAADVVEWFGGVQSQDYHPAKWAVAQRLGAGVTDADLDRAFDRGEILRTHVLRPTWHFVTPVDVRWLLELTAPRVHALNAYPYRRFGLDAALLRRATDLIAAAVAGGEDLTRAEVADLLERHGISVEERFRLAYILMYAELEQVICSGPTRGKQHTYALLEERAPTAVRLEREPALAELVRRFFTSHGPATADDLAWWSSLTRRDIAAGLALAGHRLESVDVDGVTYWSATGRTPAPARPATVRLLQGYDEYIVGYRQSKGLLDLAGRAATPSQRSLPNGVIVVDTQVAGRWKRTVRADTVALEALLYRPFDAAETAALHTAADRLGAFLDRRAVVSVKSV